MDLMASTFSVVGCQYTLRQAELCGGPVDNLVDVEVKAILDNLANTEPNKYSEALGLTPGNEKKEALLDSMD